MAKEQLSLQVWRHDPESETEPRVDSFTVPVHPGMTVMDALFYIVEELDDSLAFRYSCRGAVCGECAVTVDGRLRLACQTRLADLGAQAVVTPLPGLRVIRDLVVDMEPFWKTLELVGPYLAVNGRPPEKEYLQSPAELAAIEEAATCILCGACDAAQPAVWNQDDALGPAALVRLGRFLLDSRDDADRERADLVVNDQGIARSTVIADPQTMCPKGIDIASVVSSLVSTATRVVGGAES